MSYDFSHTPDRNNEGVYARELCGYAPVLNTFGLGTTQVAGDLLAVVKELFERKAIA